MFAVGRSRTEPSGQAVAGVGRELVGADAVAARAAEALVDLVTLVAVLADVAGVLRGTAKAVPKRLSN